MAAPAQGGVFPPFQVETFPSQVFWFAITFGALYLVIARVIVPRLGGIIAARKARIEADLATAQKFKADSENAAAAYEKSLAEARAKAQALAAESQQHVVSKMEAERKATEESLKNKLIEAESKIAASKKAAMANVSSIAGDSAGAIVEKLMGTAPNADDVARAVSAAMKA